MLQTNWTTDGAHLWQSSNIQIHYPEDFKFLWTFLSYCILPIYKKWYKWWFIFPLQLKTAKKIAADCSLVYKWHSSSEEDCQTYSLMIAFHWLPVLQTELTWPFNLPCFPRKSLIITIMWRLQSRGFSFYLFSSWTLPHLT